MENCEILDNSIDYSQTLDSNDYDDDSLPDYGKMMMLIVLFETKDLRPLNKYSDAKERNE